MVTGNLRIIATQKAPITSISPVEISNSTDLSKLLTDLLKKPNITEAEVKHITDITNNKALSLEKNVIELGNFLTLLEKNISFRASRVSDAVEHNGEALKYTLKHFSDINSAGNTAIPEELTEKLREEELAKVKSIWIDADPKNNQLLKIYASTTTSIKTFFEKTIATYPENPKLDVSYFVGAKDIDPIKKNYEVISPDYSEKDFIDFKKTISYLVGGLRRSNAKEMLYTAVLWFDSSISYSYNNKYSSIPLTTKLKKGDCTEAAFLIYSLLKMAGQKPVIYFVRKKDSTVMHVFVGVKIDGLYYVADGSGIQEGKTFSQTIQERYAKDKYEKISFLDMEKSYKYNHTVKSISEYDIHNCLEIAPE